MRQGRSYGEGMLIACVLLALIALCFGRWLDGRPQEFTVTPSHSVSAEELARAGLIDLNSADAAQLDELPGIGPALAEAIIAWRTEHGPFERIEQLDEVPGIGPTRLEALRPLVRLD